MFNWSSKICLTISLFILAISAVIWMLRHWSFRTISLAFSMFSSVLYVERHPGCSSSSTSSWSSMNSFCHSTWHHGTPPLTVGNILSNFCFNFTRNFWLIVVLDFQPSHKSDRKTQQVTLKQSSEAN
jgi:hypothetical protein